MTKEQKRAAFLLRKYGDLCPAGLTDALDLLDKCERLNERLNKRIRAKVSARVRRLSAQQKKTQRTLRVALRKARLGRK